MDDAQFWDPSYNFKCSSPRINIILIPKIVMNLDHVMTYHSPNPHQNLIDIMYSFCIM